MTNSKSNEEKREETPALKTGSTSLETTESLPEVIYFPPQNGTEPTQENNFSVIPPPSVDDDSRTFVTNHPIELDSNATPSLASTEELNEPPIQLNSFGRIPAGTMLGHFEITNYIGGGGMGCVYEGIDKALDRKVAVKVLSSQRAQDRASVARFLNEAKSAARLNHEHIAQVYFCGEERGIPFIAFEYVEGINVRSYVQEHGRIPLYQAINFILQMAGALSHAAIHGVTHRDVKPSNILITPQGNAKLIDMGLARLLKPTDPDTELTASGVTLGTFDYISPEQARDPRAADVRSDIYSLGCTFFYMLAGQPPFPEGTVLQKLLMHQGDDPPDIRTFASDIPVEISQVIQKMMAKNPKNRFQTPKALIDVLISIAEAIGLRPTGPEKTEWELPVISNKYFFLKHIPWTVSILILFIVVYGCQIFLASVDDEILPSLTLPVNNSSQNNTTDLLKTTKFSPSEKGKETIPVMTLDQTRKIPTVFLHALSEPLQSENKSEVGSSVGDNNTNQNTAENKDVNAIRQSDSFVIEHTPLLLGGIDITPVTSSLKPEEWNAVKANKEQAEKIALFLGITNPEKDLNWRYSHSRETKDVKTSIPAGPVQKQTSSLLTVDLKGKDSGTFQDLQTAIAAIKVNPSDMANQTETVIELKFNGSLKVSALPITGQNLRITASANFHPVLTFTASETTSGGGERMFLLNTTNLVFENIDIDFTVPTQNIISAEWSVFEISRGSSLTLTNTTVTVNNSIGDASYQARHGNVVFFRLNSMRNDFGNNVETKISSIAVNSSLLHGEAHLLYCRQYTLEKLDINSSLLNISGYLINYEDLKAPDRELDRMELNIKNSFVVLHSAMIFHNQKEGQRPLFPMTVNLMNSIFHLDDIPLIASTSPMFQSESVDSSSWNLDRMIFLNVSGFWRHKKMSSSEPNSDEPFNNHKTFRLDSFSTSANSTITGTAPHLFSKENFRTTLYVPLLGANMGDTELNTVKSLESVLK